MDRYFNPQSTIKFLGRGCAYLSVSWMLTYLDFSLDSWQFWAIMVSMVALHLANYIHDDDVELYLDCHIEALQPGEDVL